jgi:hypothetical protein
MSNVDFLDDDDDSNNNELPEADPNEIPESEKEPELKSDEIPEKEFEFAQDDDEDDEEEEITPRRRTRRRRIPAETKDELAEKAKKETSEELDNIVEELAPGRNKNVFLTITRVEPKIYKGKKIEGFVERRDSSITEDELKETYGGGVYDVKFFGPKRYNNGQPVGNKILRLKRIKISGDPIIEDRKTSGVEDPSIVSMAIKAQQDLLSRKDEEQQNINKQNKELLDKLLSGGGNSKTDAGMIQLVQSVLESVKQTANMQLISAQEQMKTMREEINRKEERYQEQLRRIEEKSEKATMPMLDYLTKQQSESNTKSEIMLKHMTEMFKVQLQSAQEASKNQIEMIQASHKMQSDMLMNELKRQSEELKDARISGKTDLLSEMKKLASIKNIMSEIGTNDATQDGNNNIAEKLIEKIPEIAESVPSIISAIGELFGSGKGTRQVVRNVAPIKKPIAALPPSPVIKPIDSRQEAKEEINNNDSNNNENDSGKEQRDIAIMIATIVSNIENSIANNKTPEQFINEYIIGKFNNETLKKVTSVPPGAILAFVEQNINVNDDNIITTTQGRDYIRNCLLELKKKV